MGIPAPGADAAEIRWPRVWRCVHNEIAMKVAAEADAQQAELRLLLPWRVPWRSGHRQAASAMERSSSASA